MEQDKPIAATGAKNYGRSPSQGKSPNDGRYTVLAEYRYRMERFAGAIWFVAKRVHTLSPMNPAVHMGKGFNGIDRARFG